MANILMEHLPPSGWSDVARRQDLEIIDLRFEGVDRRFDEIERRFDYMDRRINILDGRMKLMITGILGFGLALLAIQVQVLLSLADLSSKVSGLKVLNHLTHLVYKVQRCLGSFRLFVVASSS
jgi:hypothetical protein